MRQNLFFRVVVLGWLMTIAGAALASRDGARCSGYPFEKDESYLIYVWADRDGLYRTSRCSRTKPLDEAAEELDQLTRLIE